MARPARAFCISPRWPPCCARTSHYGGAATAKGRLLPHATDLTMAAAKHHMATKSPLGGAAVKAFHAYRLNTSLSLADIRVVSLARLFGAVLAAPGTLARFAIAASMSADMMVQAVLDPHDYSAARGIADAVFDQGRVQGLVANSARGDSDTGVALYAHGDGVEGFVYALFGSPGQALSALTPVGSYASFKELVDAAKSMPGFQWIA